MGCGASAPKAPEVIIPDPGFEQCVFAIRSSGLFSDDHTVYQGETDDDSKKWFFINKTGSFWTGNAEVMLENFQRGWNPEKPQQGQVLWSAQFSDKPDFQKFHKAPTIVYNPYVSGFFATAPMGERPDADYFKAAPWGMNDAGWRRVMKWKVSQSARINGGTRMPGRSFTLQAFITGTSVCDYDKWQDHEGHQKWKRQEAEFVDTAQFQLTDMHSGQPVAQWWFPGDLAGDGDLEQNNPLFYMKLNGGWMSMKPVVWSGQGWDPTLSLLIAYFCCYEYAPWAVKKDLNNDFPDDPTGWPGYS